MTDRNSHSLHESASHQAAERRETTERRETPPRPEAHVVTGPENDAANNAVNHDAHRNEVQPILIAERVDPMEVTPVEHVEIAIEEAVSVEVDSVKLETAEVEIAWVESPSPTFLESQTNGDQAIVSARVIDVPSEGDSSLIMAQQTLTKSWVFRALDGIAKATEWCLGVIALVVVLAVLSAIPVLQILTFGYLLECARRVTHTGRFWSGAVGIRKAARVGSLLAGTAICLLPIQYISSVWYAAHILDPDSQTTLTLRITQLTLTILIVPHIIAAWYCGGRLRNFFWPLLAPVTLSLWLVRKAADSRLFRPLLNNTIGLISPRLVEDLCRAKPLSDWFLPAVVLRGLFTGKLLTRARDGLYDFLTSLRLPHYFSLGFRGLVGTFIWLAIPLALLIGVAQLPNELATLSGFLGAIAMSIVLLYVPFAQVQFAHSNQLKSMFDIGQLRYPFRRAPLLHTFSLFVLLALSLPLYVFKIETIPVELLWLPAVIFLLMTWPARVLIAYAYARGFRRVQRRTRWLTWPSRLVQWPLTLTFTLFLFVSQYVAWNGSLSLLEQHVVSIPAPFLRMPF